MITEKMELHSRVLGYLSNIVTEESIPVNITVGAKHKDYNGDTQVDVLLEYKKRIQIALMPQ